MSAHKFPNLNGILDRYLNLFYDEFNNPNGTSTNLQLFVDKVEERKSNKYYWMENYDIDTLATPLPADPRATATYSQGMAKQTIPSIFDWASPMSETNQRSKGGHRTHESTIPRFNAGDLQTAMSIQETVALGKQFGNDKKIMELYKMSLNDFIDAGHYTFNRLCAQEMSTGAITGWGLMKPTSPLGSGMNADQFHTPNVDLRNEDTDVFKWIYDFVEQLNMTYSLELNWTLQVPDVILKNTWVKNTKVISIVGSWKAKQGAGTVILLNQSGDTNPADVTPKFISVQDIIDYSRSDESMIPPIEIQIENQTEQLASGQILTGRGWNVNNIAFKPGLKSGLIKWTDIPDMELIKEFGAPNVPTTFAKALGGIMGIINSVQSNGKLADFHQDFYLAARPQLTDFVYRQIVYTDKVQP